MIFRKAILPITVLSTTVLSLIFSLSYNQPSKALAVAGDVIISGGSGGFTGNLTGSQLIDQQNAAYYVDPGSATNSLLTAGKVGIGTTNPSQPLDVNGYGIFGNSAYTMLYLRDDESTTGPKSIHANSNVIGFLNGAGAWASYWDNAGNQNNIGQIVASSLYSNGLIYSTGNVYVNGSGSTSNLNIKNATGTAGPVPTVATNYNAINIEYSNMPFAGNMPGISWSHTTAPTAPRLVISPYIDTNGGASYIGFFASPAGTTINGQAVYVGPGGAMYATSWTTQSDERLKSDVKKIDHALEKLEKIKGITFNWKDGHVKERQMGVLAQDVQKVAPELINKIIAPGNIKDELGVSYDGLNAITIEAIKELHAKVEDQQRQIDELKALVSKIQGE